MIGGQNKPNVNSNARMTLHVGRQDCTSGVVQQLRPHDVVMPVAHLTNMKPKRGQVLLCT